MADYYYYLEVVDNLDYILLPEVDTVDDIVEAAVADIVPVAVHNFVDILVAAADIVGIAVVAVVDIDYTAEGVADIADVVVVADYIVAEAIAAHTVAVVDVVAVVAAGNKTDYIPEPVDDNWIVVVVVADAAAVVVGVVSVHLDSVHSTTMVQRLMSY